MLTTELIDRILATVPNRTIGLIGDLFLDRYLDIDPARDEPSVETNLTAYQVTRVRAYPGALGTVLNNLVALGVGQLLPVTVIGDDGEGYEVRQCLSKMRGVRDSGLVIATDRRTPTYTKPMYGDRELNRLDIKNRTPTPAELEDQILGLLYQIIPECDALLVLDQVSEVDCGVITKKVREHLSQLAKAHPQKFILADSREQIREFRDVGIKPNWEECRKAAWVNPPAKFTREDDAFMPLELAMLANGPVFATNGQKGMVVVHRRDKATDSFTTTLVPAYAVTGPIDICGAGDSCSAGIACAMVSGASHTEAAAFGNLIASITIQQIGTTGTASPDQVRRRWKEVGERGA